MTFNLNLNSLLKELGCVSPEGPYINVVKETLAKHGLGFIGYHQGKTQPTNEFGTIIIPFGDGIIEARVPIHEDYQSGRKPEQYKDFARKTFGPL